jgi:L-threonylcarbamoyladenylate synthase
MPFIIRLDAGLEPAARDLDAAAAAAKAGKILAFPTDTVYGLGSSGLDWAAARRIYELKGRSAAKPLPILAASPEDARRWVEWTPEASELSRRFWPGALTLVLRPTEAGRALLSPGQETLAIRVPDHAVLRGIIALSGVPWVSTSANLSGSAPLTDGGEVLRAFGDLADVVILGGRTPGVASTVVDARRFPLQVLREGALKESVAA